MATFQRPAAAALAAGAVAVLAAGATGCAAFDAALGKQEAVVAFQPHTSTAQMLQIRAACSHIPEAKPERLPAHMIPIQAGYDIKYLVSNASDAQVARLEQCLGRFKSVVGVSVTSPDGS